jgi:hypothetical protein
MSGRRSHARFLVSPPASGVVRVLSDAEIESIRHQDLSVISREAAAIGERMLLEFPGHATDVVVPVQVVETRPVIVSQGVRHFVRLHALDGLPHSARDRFAEIQRFPPAPHMADRRLVTVIREIPVRLVNCSRSGCLIEADRSLEAGTAGTLSLVLEGYELADHILVTRCQPIAGAGSLHHIGARLLWVEAPSVHTIRRGLAAVENPV